MPQKHVVALPLGEDLPDARITMDLHEQLTDKAIR